ncbi:MAG: L-rhamnose mutarotase [Flavobacteriaceae bacterium]
MKRYALALDLKNDPRMIAEYEEYHKKVWPEILESIHAAGILVMEIYRIGNRLFMMLEVEDSFSFGEKESMDAKNPIVSEWEHLMWKYQQALPMAKPGEKWLLMKKIFETGK